MFLNRPQIPGPVDTFRFLPEENFPDVGRGGGGGGQEGPSPPPPRGPEAVACPAQESR